MEKILQIVAVFVLMTLIIHRFIRGREPRYRPYDYLTRLKPPVAAEAWQRLVTAGQPEAMIMDEARQLQFLYKAEGSVTIYWQNKEMQCLAAPLNCTSISLDPADGRLYLEAEGFLFVYGA